MLYGEFCEWHMSIMRFSVSSEAAVWGKIRVSSRVSSSAGGLRYERTSALPHGSFV